MGRGKGKGRPRRLFREPRIPPETMRLVEALFADHPDWQEILVPSLAALCTAEFGRAWDGCAHGHQRAGMLLAWRDAAARLKDGKPCDFCPDRATRVRFSAVWPGEDFRRVSQVDGQNCLLGFLVVCNRCAAMGEAELKRRVLDDYAEAQPELGGHPWRRATVVGVRVGEAAGLPARRALEECGDCGATIWISQDARDKVTGEVPLFVCDRCAVRRFEDGRMEYVPEYLTGS